MQLANFGATHGTVQVTVGVAGQDVDIAYSVDEVKLSLRFPGIDQKDLSFLTLVRFLLDDNGYEFPGIASFLNDIALRWIALDLLFKAPAFLASATFQDFSIGPPISATVQNPRLDAEIRPGQPKICVSGRLSGGAFDGKDVWFCFPKWEPTGSNGEPLVTPETPGIGPLAPYLAVAACVALLVAAGYAAWQILQNLAATQALSELIAALDAQQVALTEIIQVLRQMNIQNQEILEQMVQGLNGNEGIPLLTAQLESVDAMMTASLNAGEPLTQSIADVLPDVQVN